tara:strand:+ start:723 stop:923 length:201 start_codon:yes stop_codon:yes gene_type:complete
MKNIDNLIQITSWLDPDDKIFLANETITNREWIEREASRLKHKIITNNDGKIAVFRNKKYKKGNMK